jgi:hypothetical protein
VVTMYHVNAMVLLYGPAGLNARLTSCAKFCAATAMRPTLWAYTASREAGAAGRLESTN